MKKLLSVLLVLAMALSFVAIAETSEEETSTLVVGYSYFSAKFSPFFAKTAYDQDIADIVSLALFSSDREGNVVLNGIEGEVRPYNGTDYTYTGPRTASSPRMRTAP